MLQRKNKNLFLVTFLENLVIIFKNLILKGYAAVIVQLFGSLLLIFKLKQFKNKKMYNLFYYAIILLQIIVSICFNNQGIIGFLPIFSSSGYYLLINFVQKNILIKILLVINLSIWIIYYLFLKDYVGAIANLISITFTIVIIIKQFKDEKNKN